MFQRLKPISPLRFAFFSAACGLVAFSSFLLFGALIGDDSDRGQTARGHSGLAMGVGLCPHDVRGLPVFVVVRGGF